MKNNSVMRTGFLSAAALCTLSVYLDRIGVFAAIKQGTSSVGSLHSVPLGRAARLLDGDEMQCISGHQDLAQQTFYQLYDFLGVSV